MLKRLRVILVAVVVVAALLAAAAPALAVHRPTRVMIVVMDQMHPEYAKQYNMTNVLWLQNHGVTFPNAYVGDMASETVVSHNVMVSGLLPKHMGWSDEALRDTTDVLDGGANGIYVTGDLSYAQFQQLVAAGAYPKLGTYLHAKFPGSVVACVGQKSYQVRSMTAGSADLGVFLGSTKSGTNGGDPALISLLGGAYRGPSIIGTMAAPYITADPNNRFFVNSDPSNDYGTLTQSPAWIYPEDGDRMVPGFNEGHLGGDNWVADATIKIMQNEDWSGLFVNFGAIDKIGHMWGGGEADNLKNYQWDPNSIFNQVHEPFIAKNADTQLGRLIGTLKALHEFDSTLIVVVADHGSTAATKHFYGVDDQNAGDFNWYYGDSLTDGNFYNMPGRVITPALKPLIDTGNVAFNYSSTAIETWLTAFTMAKKQAAAKVMRKLPGVIATYMKSDDGTRYVLDTATKTKTKMTLAEHAWWKLHGQQLVNTMAWSGSADVVGLLANRTSYGAFGDHGGAQKDVQRIPMAWYMPGIKHAVSENPLRLVDIMPTMLKALGITPTHPMDGHAFSLSLPQ
jgi:Type I phosphodiesterase / nucleotide pyrophosphatase